MTDQRSARILVIDDEVTQRILVKEYLEEAGYIVRLSDDGRRGLKMAAATKPDLIILDLMLPSMDGYTLCTCLKQAESTANIPIILITASREAGVIDRGLAAGADDFVTKPVDWAFLADRVKMVLARAQQQKSSGPAAQTAPPAEAVPAPQAQDDTAMKAVEERAAAEIERIKAETQAELRTAAQRHALAFEAAKANIQAEAQKAAEAAQNEAVATLKAVTGAERVSLEQKHSAQMSAVREQAQRDIDTVKAAAKTEIARIEMENAEKTAAAVAEAEARIRSQFGTREADDRNNAERHRSEIAAMQASTTRQIEALRQSYDAKLAAAAEFQALTERLEADLKAAEQRHQSEVLSLAESSGRERDALRDTYEAKLRASADENALKLAAVMKDAEEKLSQRAQHEEISFEAEAEFADRVRSSWEFSRAASVSCIDAVSGILDSCKAAHQAVQNGEQPGSAYNAVAEIEHTAREMAASLGKLRMLAQVMSGGADFRDTIFDLSKLASDAVAAVKDHADSRKVALSVELPDQPVVIRADHARLSYAIVSVLANALRFTPAGGSVAVALKLDGGEAARLEITDSGVGIAPVMLDSLRTCLDRPGDVVTGSGDGVGFGVPVVTALVRQHGGHVEIESGLGRGTQFAIVLPLGRRGQTAASGRADPRRRSTG